MKMASTVCGVLCENAGKVLNIIEPHTAKPRALTSFSTFGRMSSP